MRRRGAHVENEQSKELGLRSWCKSGSRSQALRKLSDEVYDDNGFANAAGKNNLSGVVKVDHGRPLQPTICARLKT